jgi:hypothetical protein
MVLIIGLQPIVLGLLKRTLKRDREDVNCRTSTIQVVANEVLQGKANILHDLESFFFVFIWVCACEALAICRVRRWYTRICLVMPTRNLRSVGEGGGTCTHT